MPQEIKEKTETYPLCFSEVELKVNITPGWDPDTKVSIGGGEVICTIEGDKRQAFIQELRELIDKYAI